MKTFKLIMLIALIFATGFVGGVVTTRIVVRHFIHRAIEQPDCCGNVLNIICTVACA